MKKLIMILCLVSIVSISCSEQEIVPMQEVPQDLQLTDGDDDDEDCGQVGGGCPTTN